MPLIISRRRHTRTVKRRILAYALAQTSMALSASFLLLFCLVSITSAPLLELDLDHKANHGTKEPIQSLPKQKHPVAGLDIITDNVWASKFSQYYHGCSYPTDMFQRRSINPGNSTGYILVQTSGGLNQQRTGIINAVVVARVLNATLVVPHLDHKSFWKDNSNFSDIFDIDKFLDVLKSDVPVLKELPTSLASKIGEHIQSVRVPRKCTPEYFIHKVLPVLQKKKVIRLTKFDYRLSNRLDMDLQRLRCRVNYEALHFTLPIRSMGEVLVARLRQKSSRYIALHLRFEPDMLAFSGCYYGGGEDERRDLGLIRKRWKSLHPRDPDRERRNGKCPLTPEEVGLMLRALGFGSDSHLYVASGEIYGGERTLAPLKALFPNFYTKDSLASKEELRPFIHYSSRMAAIDFIVCHESDVFVANNNGNMARMLAGNRRYFGHKRTVRPNAKKLGKLFITKSNLTWDEFTLKVQRAQNGFMGEPRELRPGSGQFFENPDACICESSQAKDERKIANHHEVRHDETYSEPDDDEDSEQDGEVESEELQDIVVKESRIEDNDTEEISWFSD